MCACASVVHVFCTLTFDPSLPLLWTMATGSGSPSIQALSSALVVAIAQSSGRLGSKVNVQKMCTPDAHAHIHVYVYMRRVQFLMDTSK